MNKGKVAVVTGAGGVLCGPIVFDLARQGYKLVLIGRTLDKLESRAAKVREEGGECMCIAADVTDEAEIKAACDKVNAAYGKVSVLINGAGGNQMDVIANVNEFSPEELEQGHQFRGFFDLKMDRFLDVVNVNIMGTVIPCQVFARDMAEAGGGAIVSLRP